jgi:hypothetical protein
MRTIAAITALMLMSSPAAALDASGNWTAKGVVSCGKWLEYKREGGGLRQTAQVWLAGVFTGANRY